MPKYFFDVQDGEHHHVDVYGAEYTEMAAARQDAVDIARTILSEAMLIERSRLISVTLRSDSSRPLYIVQVSLIETEIMTST